MQWLFYFLLKTLEGSILARNSVWNEAKFKRFLEEKRGKGEKSEYRPWLLISDLASRGRSTRIFSRKENRTIHLFTDQQLHYYFLLEWDISVVSFKEQYPLLDTETIIDQLDEKLLKRLKSKESDVPHVMLTTFLITAVNKQGKEYQYARTIKNASELEKSPTIDRLELQRRWWLAQNIDFGIITEREIPAQFSKNIEWVLSSLNVEDYGLTVVEMELYAEHLLLFLYRKDESIHSLISVFERDLQVATGTGVLVFRYLIAKRRMQINMKIELTLQLTPSELGIDFQNDRKGEVKHVSSS
jgi:hypothetical protein